MAHVILMNSLMMPDPAYCYCPERLDPKTFGFLVREAYDLGVLVSYIGYQSTASLIEKLADLPPGSIPVSREETQVGEWDLILVAKLKYRLRDPKEKGTFAPSLEDMEFYQVHLFTRFKEE